MESEETRTKNAADTQTGEESKEAQIRTTTWYCLCKTTRTMKTRYYNLNKGTTQCADIGSELVQTLACWLLDMLGQDIHHILPDHAYAEGVVADWCERMRQL